MAGIDSSDPGALDDFGLARRTRKSRRRNYTIIALLILAGAGWFYWQQSQEVVEEDEPLIATVEMGSIENTIASAGTLKGLPQAGQRLRTVRRKRMPAPRLQRRPRPRYRVKPAPGPCPARPVPGQPS